MIRDLIKSTVKKAVGRVMGSPAQSAPPPPPPAPRWADPPARAEAAPKAPEVVAAQPPEPAAPVAAPVVAPVEVAEAPVEAAPAAAPVQEAASVEEAPAAAKKRGGRKKKDAAAIVAALEEAAPAEVAAPETVPAPAASEAVPAPAPADDTAGPALFMEELQAYVDEFVRPALQSDGGDMTLVKYEDNVLYVSLVGACKTCPSSTMTLRMGVESTLKEEFPQIRELVQVD